PVYKTPPAYLAPPIRDPFPSLLETGKTPPIPSYNTPEPDLWKQYDRDVLTKPPPLLIGFTRSWPMLLQTVVSYITAGWPPEQIHVVENTGTQQANARGQLTLQNPFYLNHTTLAALGVNVIQTPVLMTFAQLQNFYLSLTYANDWPYYFWSHMDALVLSPEGGIEKQGVPRAGEKGYKSIYKLAVEELNRTMLEHEGKWSMRFFAYDALSLMNPRALEDVGGWDTLIPYYITDCDLYTRFLMKGWTSKDVDIGIITDVSTTLDDLGALYRDPKIVPAFTDPNPPPPEEEKKEKTKKRELAERDGEEVDMSDPVAYWHRLRDVANNMFHYKHGNRGRNTWQMGQHGGQNEPFYYPAAGLAQGIEMLTDTGKAIYGRKWAKGDCDLIADGGLQFDDQWTV
ncbi:hypothetical protein Micbo1qcDRAFT_111753, partial [Microdochium bolleyi]